MANRLWPEAASVQTVGTGSSGISSARSAHGPRSSKHLLAALKFSGCWGGALSLARRWGRASGDPPALRTSSRYPRTLLQSGAGTSSKVPAVLRSPPSPPAPAHFPFLCPHHTPPDAPTTHHLGCTCPPAHTTLPSTPLFHFPHHCPPTSPASHSSISQHKYICIRCPRFVRIFSLCFCSLSNLTNHLLSHQTFLFSLLQEQSQRL